VKQKLTLKTNNAPGQNSMPLIGNAAEQSRKFNTSHNPSCRQAKLTLAIACSLILANPNTNANYNPR